MAISCGACGKLMRYTQSVLSCSGNGCKAMAHYACVASSRQDWRCVGCCYPTEVGVQYLLGEILKKGSGLELLQGLIGKINDLLTDINTIKDENDYLKKEITLLLNHKGVNIADISYNKRKTINNEKSQIPITTIDLVSSEDETNQPVSTTSIETITSSIHQQSVETPKKLTIFVSWTNTTQGETYLKQYLQERTEVKSMECLRVSCYDTYSMFQIKVDENEAHLLKNTEVYPQGCKVEVFGR